MKRICTIIFCLAFNVCMMSTISYAGDAEKAGIQVAESWLVLVDGGKYSESWDEAASLLKRAITKEKWDQSLEAIRPPLGDVVSRNVKSTKYATSLPQNQDIEYVVIQYTTTFKNKERAIETVTPMKDQDGKWRVSRYSVE